MFALIPGPFLALMDRLTLGNSFGLPGLQTPSSVYASSAHLHMVVLVSPGPQISLAQSSLHSHQPASHLLLGAMSFLFCSYIRGVQGLLEQAQLRGLPPSTPPEVGSPCRSTESRACSLGGPRPKAHCGTRSPDSPLRFLPHADDFCCCFVIVCLSKDLKYTGQSRCLRWLQSQAPGLHTPSQLDLSSHLYLP